jgi:signal transduction histidine kinase
VQRLEPPSSTIRRGDTFPLEDTLCERAVAAAGPIAYQDSGEEGHPQSYPAYPDEPLGAYLGMPVEVAGETYGVLSFTSARAGHEGFGEFDRDLIRLMAYWLGAEIEREQSFRSQVFLASSGRALAASLDRREILERLVELAMPILGDGCVVYTLRSDGTVTRVHGGHVDPELDAMLRGLDPGTVETGSRPHPVLAALRVGEAIRESWNGGGRDRGSLLADDAWEGLPRGTCTALLVVPIRARRQVLGAVAFFSAEPEIYTDIVVATATQFTARCAAALENASLLEDARAAVRTRDEVLSFVSHDLGSPLSSISMSLEYVMGLWKKEGGSEKMRSYLEGMQEAAERMERLIEDLLAVQMLEDEHAPSPASEAGKRSVVDAGTLVEAAVRELQPRFEAGTLEFEITESTEATVRGDRNRLLRVLVNLLDNAVKFTKPGGRVEVGAAPDDDGMVRFFVSDTGKGIPEERLDRIFDRYAHAVEEQRAGAGLGLTIVRKTVEMYGGEVWAESEPGSGSTFYFTLPRG